MAICLNLLAMVKNSTNTYHLGYIPGAEMTELAEKLNYDREVIRVWFCNKRQALKNTIKKLKS